MSVEMRLVMHYRKKNCCQLLGVVVKEPWARGILQVLPSGPTVQVVSDIRMFLFFF